MNVEVEGRAEVKVKLVDGRMLRQMDGRGARRERGLVRTKKSRSCGPWRLQKDWVSRGWCYYFEVEEDRRDFRGAERKKDAIGAGDERQTRKD